MRIIKHHAALALVIVAALSFISCNDGSQTCHGDAREAPRWGKSFKPTLADRRMPDVPLKVVSFDTAEGTFMNVDVSSDGTKVVFDLLGDVYWLPIDGGQATSLTTGPAWDSSPRFSPDGQDIYFISDRGGIRNIWRATLSDQSLVQVTTSELDIEGSLNWSQDGVRLLTARSDADEHERILQLIDPNTGTMMAVDEPSEPWVDRVSGHVNRRPIKRMSAVQSAGGRIYFDHSEYHSGLERLAVRLNTFDLTTQQRESVTLSDATYDEYKPQLSHDGRLLAYFRQHQDRRTEIRILNVITGTDRMIVELSDAEDAFYYASHDTRPNYAFTPNDRQLIFWHGGNIHRVNLADGSMETIPFHVKVFRAIKERARPSPQHLDDAGEAKVVRWPNVSRDGQTMTFAAIGYIWVMDIRTQHIRRLTTSSDFEYMPALSPDGRSIAYVSFTETEESDWSGRLMVAGLDGETPRQILADPKETFMSPNWSQDGQNIALIREVHSDNGIESTFGWTPAENGVFHEVASAHNNFFNIAIYGRSVGFDETGANIVFSFQSPKTETTSNTDAVTILAAAALDGSAKRTLAVGAPGVAGITPSPDLTSLALTRQDETVWLVPFQASSNPATVSTTEPDARLVSDGGGYYVSWNGPEEVTFGLANNICRYRLDAGEAEVLPAHVPFEKSKATQPVAFKGARLITVSGDRGVGTVIESGTLVLDGRRISAIGLTREITIPADAIVIDATGKTIMPGLLDVHYHSIAGQSLSAFKLPNADFNDRSALAYGVTMAWEPGGAWNDGVPAAVDLQESGRILGPRWSHAAQGRGRTLNFGRSPWEQFTTYANALALVKRHRALGVNVLKTSGGPNREQQQWLSAAAYRQSMGIFSHIDNLEDMLTGIVDGQTGGEHSYIPIPFYKDVSEMLRQSGYIWTPNIVISASNFGDPSEGRSYFWQHVLEAQPSELEKLKEIVSADRVDQIVNSRSSVAYDVHRASRVAEQAAVAAQNGVRIGVSAHNMPGAGLHSEMWYLWKGGLPIEDVLRATTIGNAQKLGLQEEVGSLEVGKLADFLVLHENPLDDILNTLSLKYTVQGGVVYDSATAERIDVSTIAASDGETVH